MWNSTASPGRDGEAGAVQRGLGVARRDDVAGAEPRDAADRSDVEQHPAGHDLRQRLDAEPVACRAPRRCRRAGARCTSGRPTWRWLSPSMWVPICDGAVTYSTIQLTLFSESVGPGQRRR